MSTLQNTTWTQRTITDRLGAALIAAGAMIAIALTVLIITLTSARTGNPPAPRATPLNPVSQTARVARGVIDPETGLMHGGYVRTPLPVSSHRDPVNRPHSVMDPETGLMHGA